MAEGIRLRSYLGSRLSGFHGGAHFTLPGIEPKVAYTYIRKNGCSAFKAFILRNSPERPQDEAAELEQLFAVAGIRSFAAFRSHPRRVLVYREPVARIASLYLNKFVQRRGHEDLFASYRAVAGQPPEEASFADFVARYVARADWKQLDPHVMPQILQLAPVPYTHAIALPDLPVRIAEVVGPEIAAAYFAKPANATSTAERTVRDGLGAAPADALHAEYREAGRLPAPEALLDGGLRRKLGRIYAADLRMIRRIEAVQPRHG